MSARIDLSLCAVRQRTADGVSVGRCDHYVGDDRTGKFSGPVLRRARELSGKSMGKVAREIGVNVTELSAFERGVGILSKEQIAAFVEAVRPATEAP